MPCTAALIVVVPVLTPVFVIVPTLLIAPVLIATVLDEPALLTKIFPVPVIPPLTVKAPVVPCFHKVTSFPFKLIAPLKVGAELVVLLSIVIVPTAFVAMLIGLEIVYDPPIKVAESPAASPRVIALADGPAPPLTVVALLTLIKTIPLIIFKPPVNVFAPDKINCPVFVPE